MPTANSDLTQSILALQPGDHLCLIYGKDPVEQMPALIPFVQDALTQGEQFIYVAEDQSVDELAARLVQGGIDVEGARAQGRLNLWTREEWRQPGELSSERKSAQIRQIVEAALAAGFKGVRFAVEMPWGLDPDIGVRELEHWEATLNTIFVPGFPGKIICQYNRSRLSPEMLQAALRTHPRAILGDKVYANFFYQAPPNLALRGPAKDGAKDAGWTTAMVEWMISRLKHGPAPEREQEDLSKKEADFAKSDLARHKLERMLGGICDGCVALDAEWRFAHVNEAAARLLGKPAAELLGKQCWQEFPAMAGGRLEQVCKRAMAEQATMEFGGVFLPGDRWFEFKAYPLSPGELALCFRDITELKRAAGAVAALKPDHGTHAEKLPQPHDLDLGGGRTTVQALEPMLREVLRAALTVDGADMGLLSLGDPLRAGLRPSVSSGLGPDFLQISEFIPPGVGVCGVCFQRGQLVIAEDVEQDPLFVRYRETARVGGFRGVHSTPLTVRGGRVVGVLSVFFRQPHRPAEREIRLIDLYARQAADSIEYTRLLDESSQAREVAEQAGKAKDHLVAALALELRAPLNPVLLVATEGAGNAELSAEVRDDFNNIARNITLEARLIDDLLDLTGIAQGKRVFEMRALSAHDILQNALVAVRPELERKFIALTLDLKAVRHTIKGDALRLQQVFCNVLGNAAKFSSEKGMVALETRTIAAKGMLAVTITDAGSGMTADELASAFNAFALPNRFDRGGPRRSGGMGIGLARSRMLVELHGGRIRAFSAGRDQGSTFVIELPLAAAEKTAGSASGLGKGSKPPLAARVGATGQRFSILLVEDHEPTRVALAKLLMRRRYDVFTAGSVAEALTLADRKNFDLLVSDIGLPDADGYELMKTLRARHGLKGIAVTGYGMEQDIARSKAAGFVAHLTKPVSAQTFDQALAAAAAD